MRNSREGKIVKSVPRSKDPMFGLVKPGEGDSGTIYIPKSKMLASKDPDAFRRRISEEYTAAVQKYPEMDFSILVDEGTDAIRITWKKRT
jgi:hypothetical protein